jgi:predicted RNA-binding Zn-ribbon protein involved in translation (DUF1610 family)
MGLTIASGVVVSVAGDTLTAVVQFAWHGQLCQIALSPVRLRVDNTPEQMAARHLASRRDQQMESLARRLTQIELGPHAVGIYHGASDEEAGLIVRLRSLQRIAVAPVPPIAHTLALWPVWFSVLALELAWLARAIYEARVRRYRHEAKLCLSCGYDLRSSIGRCPECGTALDIAHSSHRNPALGAAIARFFTIGPHTRRALRTFLSLLRPPRLSGPPAGLLLFICGISLYFQCAANFFGLLTASPPNTAVGDLRDLAWTVGLFVGGTIVLCVTRRVAEPTLVARSCIYCGQKLDPDRPSVCASCLKAQRPPSPSAGAASDVP